MWGELLHRGQLPPRALKRARCDPYVWGMRKLAPELSARDALGMYLEENGFDAAEYTAPRGTVWVFGIEASIPNPPSRQRLLPLHDLHHVVTGYGTDLVGEAEVSAWELRGGLGHASWYERLLVTSVLLTGCVIAPLRTWRAWRAGQGARSLFAEETHIEQLYAMSVSELRAYCNAPPDGIAQQSFSRQMTQFG